MRTGELVALCGAAALAGVFFYQATSESRRQGGQAERDGVALDAHASFEVGDDLDRAPYICQPSDMGDNVLRRRHPLYRRPHVSRPHHTRLCRDGFEAWIVDPPSEMAGGA